MTPLLARLQSFARDRDFMPLFDPPTSELERLRELFLPHAHHVHAHPPGDDAYSHRLEVALDRETRAEVMVRFDLRTYVVMICRATGPAFELVPQDAQSRERCRPLHEQLRRRGIEELDFDEARLVLSDEMITRGFIDNTILAYFFEG